MIKTEVSSHQEDLGKRKTTKNVKVCYMNQGLIIPRFADMLLLNTKCPSRHLERHKRTPPPGLSFVAKIKLE